MKRKALSIILALSMVLSMLPVTAWAAETEPEEAAETVISPDGGEDAISPGGEEVTPPSGEDAAFPSGEDVASPGDEEAPEIAVAEVQALIDALPSVEEARAMDTDGQRAAYNQTQTAYDAYKALSEAQRGLVTGVGVFEELFAFFNGQVMLLATASVSYVNAQGQSQTNVTATVVESDTTTWSDSTTNGWYVVDSNVTIGGRIEVSGTVNLILADSGNLSAQSGGIHVPTSASLTIWGQSGGTGALTAATSSVYYAAIGGNRETGGHGPITINGGHVSATAPVSGGYNAGIGGGGSNTDIDATADGHDITINGGVVTAQGGQDGAGIGGGRGGRGYNITITGGTVTTTGGGSGAGIGGGRRANGENIRITGGTVTATGGSNNAAGIGGGGGSNSPATGSNNVIDGNAVVRVSGSKTTQGMTVRKGVLFERGNGTVRGDVTLDGDLTIGAGETLEVPAGSSLTSRGTITNEGIITNEGAIDGNITNTGLLVNKGELSNSGAPEYIITAPTGLTGLVYNGSDQALVTSGEVSPGGGPVMQYSLNGAGYSADIPKGKNVGTYSVGYKVTGSGIIKPPASSTLNVDTGNNQLTVTGTVSAGIVQAELQISSVTVQPRTYEPGNSKVTISNVTLTGIYGNDDVELDISKATAAMVDADAGTDKTVTVTGFGLIGTSAGNYKLAQSSFTTNVTITQAQQAAPAAIQVEKTSDSITVTSPTGLSAVGTQCQYFVGGTTVPVESEWSDSPNFTGLESDKEYTVYVRYKGNTNYYASTHIMATVFTLSADGSATLHPGESVTANGTTVTNNGDHITVTDEADNTTTVTPVPENGVEVDRDGNVTVPKGGKVRTGTGPERTLPEGGTVSGDGTITADEIVVGDTTVKGDDVTADKNGNVTVPEGGVVKPKDGPEMTLPDGGVVEADGDITFPEGGSAKVGDTTVTVPEGGAIKPDGSGNVSVPGGSTATPPGGPDVTLPQGGTVDADGKVLPEGGNFQVGGAAVTVPEESGALEPNGKGGVEIPEGSTVTPPGGPDITVGPENGGTVDKDGSVTLPEGGSAKVGDATVTVPENGGTLKPDGKGSVTVPGGSTVVDGEGKEHTVPSQGGTVGKDGTYKDNPVPGSGHSGSSGNFGSSGGDYVSTYTTTVSQAEHGKVTVSPTNAYSGQIVTITVKSDEGYILSDLTVTDSRGNELTLTDKGDGVYTFIMPFGGITVEALFVPWMDGETGTDSPASALSPASAFSDLSPDAWYWDAVDYVIRNGLMNGYGYRERTFGPNDTLSRAMLAQALYNQIGRPGVNGNILLADASSGAWYTDAITWAATNEIIYGYGKGKYGPDDPITREQLAVMLYRFERSRGGGFAGEWTPDYSDTSEISEYALESVTWCAVNGILGGYDDGALRPGGNATRAEAAVMLMRFLSL